MNTAQCAEDAALLMYCLPGLGPSAYWQILEHFGDIESAFEASDKLLDSLPEQARHLAADYFQQGSSSAVAQKMALLREQAQAAGAELILHSHVAYPRLLREIRRPPPRLWCRGSSAALNLPQLAIVGSRRPTPGGRDNAKHFAEHLAVRGFAITSGLAQGIDTFAHQGALSAEGKTIAVMATGIEQIYPARNRGLADEILACGGALISEFPPGTAPSPQNFPQRNRIISGLCGGTLVVEAAVRSGSLITARCAVQQNREVFAIPGSIHNPLARGCHALIREGAKLVETVGDIAEELGSVLAVHQLELLASGERSAEVLDETEKVVIAALGYDGVDLEILVQRTGLAAAELASSLMTLELKGYIEDSLIGYVRVQH